MTTWIKENNSKDTLNQTKPPQIIIMDKTPNNKMQIITNKITKEDNNKVDKCTTNNKVNKPCISNNNNNNTTNNITNTTECNPDIPTPTPLKVGITPTDNKIITEITKEINREDPKNTIKRTTITIIITDIIKIIIITDIKKIIITTITTSNNPTNKMINNNHKELKLNNKNNNND